MQNLTTVPTHTAQFEGWDKMALPLLLMVLVVLLVVLVVLLVVLVGVSAGVLDPLWFRHGFCGSAGVLGWCYRWQHIRKTFKLSMPVKTDTKASRAGITLQRSAICTV